MRRCALAFVAVVSLASGVAGQQTSATSAAKSSQSGAAKQQVQEPWQVIGVKVISGGACRARSATPSDVKPGSPVDDEYGTLLGSIESAAPDGAVIKTDDGYVRVPLGAFGKCRQGLVLEVMAGQFKKLVLAAHASH